MWQLPLRSIWDNERHHLRRIFGMQRAPRVCEALFFSDTRSGNFLQQLVGIRAQHAQHPFAQFVGADRLGPIFQHASFFGPALCVGVAQRRQNDDLRVLLALVAVQAARHFQAVHFGHHDVQQNQIGLQLLHL